MKAILFIFAYSLVAVGGAILDRLLREKEPFSPIPPPGQDELIYRQWCMRSGQWMDKHECGRFEDAAIEIEMTLMSKHIPTRG